MPGNDSFWDRAFSDNNYQIVSKIEEITKINNVNNWFSVRSKELIRGTKSFRITMPVIGYVGAGTRNMVHNGFPGYTPEAWMINTNGLLLHNNVKVLTNSLIKF